MGRLPEGKVALSIYVTPKCKKKLDCLQKLFAIADRDFSLSRIVEESINMLYGAAYFCRDSWFWKGFFKVGRYIGSSGSESEGIDQVLAIIQEKKHAVKEVLTVDVDLKENAKEQVREFFSRREKK